MANLDFAKSLKAKRTTTKREWANASRHLLSTSELSQKAGLNGIAFFMKHQNAGSSEISICGPQLSQGTAPTEKEIGILDKRANTTQFPKEVCHLLKFNKQAATIKPTKQRRL